MSEAATSTEGQGLRSTQSTGDSGKADLARLQAEGQALREMVGQLTQQVSGLATALQGVKPLKAEDVTAAAAAAVKSALAEVEGKRATGDQRKAFIAEKLKGVPPAYAMALGEDPAKWDAEAAAITTRAKTELEAAGYKPADIGGKSTGGAAASTTPDFSKLNGQQLLEEGLKRSRPSGIAPSSAAAGAAATTGSTTTAAATN